MGIKLNLGCGTLPLEGYVNVDLYADEADVKGDFTEMTFEDVDEVAMYHSLEHISWLDTLSVLRRIRGWLAPGGRIVIEVPDCAGLFELYCRGEYPDWVQAVYGASHHPGEEHRAGFDSIILSGLLRDAGFGTIRVDQFVSTHPMRAGLPCLAATAERA